MRVLISSVKILHEEDIVYTRQRARFIAKLLGFNRIHQTRISTAISEVARNLYQYASNGVVLFHVEKEGASQFFTISIHQQELDLENREEDVLRFNRDFKKRLGKALNLMDSYQIKDTLGEKTDLYLYKAIPNKGEITTKRLEEIIETIEEARKGSSIEEIRHQNRELIETLEELQEKQEELLELNQELEDTNRGVLALYSELDEKAQQLNRANQIKTDFLSNLSHEIRTPINSIESLSKILLSGMDGELNREQKRQVSYICENVLRLSSMVNDLLEIGHLEKGKTRIHPKESTVEEIFSGLRGMLRPILKEKEIPLIFEEPTDSLPLYTDDGKVSQILRNFITNAFKFTREGEVRVKAKMSQDGKDIIFSVSDTGIGISLEDQERIFEEYTQLELHGLSHEKSMGLGLSISRMLAERLGGRVGVRSRPEEGSTFYAVIPIYYKERVDSHKDIDSIDESRPILLVVDDDPTTVHLYTKYLEEEYHLFTVQTIKEAREFLKKRRPHAIILEVLLLQENGWDFLKRLKESSTTLSIPVLVITVIEDEKRAMTLGADAYSQKPVNREWLLQRVERLTLQDTS